MHITECTQCTRIQSHLKKIKKNYPKYHCKPVHGSGCINSKICIIGLAPGLHGANKTGIPFTDDFSGKFIRGLLEEIKLDEFFITNAVRCYPEKNKPLAIEKNNCQQFNMQEISSLKKLKIIVSLGEIAYKQILKLYKIPYKSNAFRHNNLVKLNEQICLLSSYHCSKLNINTNRINREMMKDIFLKAKKIIDYE